uniref:Formylglycine-generating enzyme, required for sulfatase activity, contains SUMF1/FGE domain n=1 Tax=Candidatus Kentrum sp. TUN TaxID=2126343 RepID=A0A451A2J2_9GAMM|nr:MAG: Formylglycine-generating enzyme, required for sulfatase activity, contains SUMF1/FGE domain [Candidatus Kentron sp. TUN]VFK69687.1 MAG: Formylglycine-generating enzyme, required for sulfatase activity, contains SUMF1/FGE domain [Candidatus Kentron sp. TUN]
MSELTFISPKWLKPLLKKLVPVEKKLAARDNKARELGRISDIFGSSSDLVGCYVEPYCQDHDPIDSARDPHAISPIRAPIFSTINAFLGGDFPLIAGDSRQMFLLSEAGMGKTSLFRMLKLMHLMDFWPRGYDCLLLKLGEDIQDTVWQHSGKANTVLLLDALDEDPLAWGNMKGRLLEISEAAGDYYRVIISCRTQSLFSIATHPSDHAGQIRIDDHIYPLVFLTLFDHAQVDEYLNKRFPDHPCDILFHCNESLREQAQHQIDSVYPLGSPPLLLAHIHDLLVVKPQDSNLYHLYRALFEVWLAREEARLHKLPRKTLSNPPNREDLWTIFTTIAVFLQHRGENFLSRAALYKLEKDFPMIVDLAHIDTGERSLLHRNTSGDFRFAHHSIQEFLVARGILTGKVDVIGDAVRVTDQLLAFLKIAGVTDLAFSGRFESGQALIPMPEFHFYDQLADGSRGPALQPIPAGEFLMGSPESEGDRSEHPQHHVRIAAPFAIGTWPVTFEEYDHFCSATGRKPPSDQGWGRRRHPVINVSWQDAVDYCVWLSKETGHRYRLPSEAEWEYAARAGTRTGYWWDDRFDDGSGVRRANYDDTQGGSDVKHTSFVGSFAPNPFGLYDTAGNVWEWVADCWHDNYQNAPSDGRVWTEENLGDCAHRVVRGGSWNNDPVELRSASRSRYHASDVTYSLLGFRLAREF